jgi:hypothetical protein
MPNPYKDQIILDLKRTFTDDKKFCENNQYHDKMLNILQAYAQRNSSIGYCQGMNYLAGMIVRVVEDEEDAFWTICCLFENILPIDYFCLMTEILVDQKVFMMLLQKKKKKLFNHLKKTGLDFAIISFQWFVCLLSSTVISEVAETIWDLMFLEGSVVIFRSALAVLNIMENEILKENEFNETYIVLDTRPKELITDPELILKHISKYQSINTKFINKLRDKCRPVIMHDQRSVWLSNSRAGCPTEKDSAIFKRVKLLNKFFLLNKAIRQQNKGSEGIINPELIIENTGIR